MSLFDKFIFFIILCWIQIWIGTEFLIEGKWLYALALYLTLPVNVYFIFTGKLMVRNNE